MENIPKNIPDSVVFRNSDWTGFGYIICYRILEDMLTIKTSEDNSITNLVLSKKQKGDIGYIIKESKTETYQDAKTGFDQNIANLESQYNGKINGRIEIINSESFVFYSRGLSK